MIATADKNSIEVKITRNQLFLLIIVIITTSAFLLYPKSDGVSVDKSLVGNIEGYNSGNVIVEVFHFHATNQCWSCKTLGELTEKTVDTYFNKEIENGRLVFSHINIDLKENSDIVTKYGATGSSLWIGTYHDSVFEKEQDTNVWYKLNDEKDFMDYLKSVLENELLGEME